MGKRWRIHPHDAARIARLERAAQIPPVIAQLLVSRGIEDPQQVAAFLDCKLTGLRDPELLPGVPAAAALLHAAVKDKRRIIIYGDYDCDGMTATALLMRCLTLLGGNVGYYVPNRLEEGYGLSHDALRRIAELGGQVVVTVDCGIGSVAEAQTARELGLELIITDHHELRAELPDAAAIVHPRLPGTAYPFGGLCGAGVAFKLAWALCQLDSGQKRVSDRMRQYLLSAIGLAAIGTVADVVPLVDENRILVRHGLVTLREKPVTGLSALIRVAKLDDKEKLGSEDLAFMLAPRLNAAGRLGQAQLGVELLTTESEERAQALAEYITELNKDRDSLERRVYRDANLQIRDQFDPEHNPALVLASRDWHVGVIGIVAGRLAEKYNRPVVLIALDEFGAKPGIGSARTAMGVNLFQALDLCSGQLLRHGGHAAAAGLKIEEARIDDFRGEFCEAVGTSLGGVTRIAEVRIDAEASLPQLTLQAVEFIERLAPFGFGNPRPVLCATGVTLVEPPKKMGAGERHLSLVLHQHGKRMRGVAFGQAEWAEELPQPGGTIDIAYRPAINEYRGMKSVELHIVDWRATAAPNREQPAAPLSAAGGVR